MRTQLHRLKLELASFGEILIVTRDSVALNRALAGTDKDRFEATLRRAVLEEDLAKRLELYDAAFAEVGGPLLPDEADAWFETERGVVREIHSRALLDAADAAAHLTEWERAADYARKACLHDPFGAGPIFRLMTVEAAKGDTARALDAFSQYEEQLTEQWGIAPEARLVDLARAIRIGGMESPSRVAVTSASEPPSLPKNVHQTFGRSGAINQLAAMLLPSTRGMRRLVTLVGPGGVGKTTLAIEVGHALVGEYRGNVHFVDLSSLKDESQLLAAILRELGESVATEVSVDRIAQTLGTKPGLLILDNFEQLVDEGASTVEALIRRKTALRILVTSRRPIDLEDEQRFPLEPLFAPIFPGSKAEMMALPAVSLFVDRARRFMPTFDPDARQMRAIMRIAQRLDGLPLAIVLAASLAHSIPPEAMLDHLQTGSAWLATDSRNVSARHRGLSATIEWSLAQLDEDTRRSLHQLAWFEGGWTLAAAQSAFGGNAYQAHARLTDHSLIQRPATEGEGDARYGMLQTVREFLRHAAEDVVPTARRDHAQWVTGLVRKAHTLGDSRVNEGLALLRQEMENVRAALEWLDTEDPELHRELLAKLWRFWREIQSGHRVADSLVAALQKSDAGNSMWFGELNYGAADLLVTANRHAEAESHAVAAESAFQTEDNPRGLLGVYRIRSLVAYYEFEFVRCAEWAQRGIDMAAELNLPNQEAPACLVLGLALANLDRGEEGVRAIKRGIALCDLQKDRLRSLNQRHLLGTVYLSMRRWTDAQAILLEVLSEGETDGNRFLQAHCHAHLATVAIRTGSLSEARHRLNLVRELDPDCDSAFTSGVRTYLRTLLAVGEGDEATAKFEAAETLNRWHAMNSTPSLLPGLELVALVLASFGDAVEARCLLDGVQAIRDADGIHDSPHYRLTLEQARALTADKAATQIAELSTEDLFNRAYRALKPLVSA